MHENHPAHIERLRRSVEDVHNCDAIFLTSVDICETIEKGGTWKGEVSIFRIENHPDSIICFAWSESTDDGTCASCRAVLRRDKIRTPSDALRSVLSGDNFDKL